VTVRTRDDDVAERRVLAAGIASTTASVLPAFLTGAVGVQLRADLEITEARVGLAITAFFTTAALGSMVLGRAAERIGASSAMRLGLLISVATLVGVAAGARNGSTLVAILLLGGVANALTQPSANLLLADRVRPERLGLGMALKQAGMPAATMLGGLAVPMIALTVGWRWAYVAGAGVAMAALTLVPSPDRGRAPIGTGPCEVTAGGARPVPAPPRRGRPDQPLWLLVLLSAAACLGATAAGALAAFLVSGAEAAGMGEGSAGLLLTGGSALGIASRLAHGWLADRHHLDPLRRVTILLAVGGLGYVLMTLHAPWAYVLGAPVAFAFGWSWPGLFNLAVVRANPSAPAAATGTTQTGVYVGALAGPALFGLLVERAGYGVAWAATAAISVGAAAVLVEGRRRLRGFEGLSRSRPTEPVR
jgi:MFS family permease